MMHQFFRKRLLRYTMAIMIPTLLLIIWSLYQTASDTIRTITSESVNSTERIAQATDTMISDVVYQHELIAGNPQLALSLRKVLSADSFYYDDYLYFNTLTGLIRSLKNSFPYVSSIYIELDSYHKFFSSEDGIRLKEDYYDQSWLDTIQSLDSANPQYCERRGLSLYSILPERDIVTIYQRMTTLKGTIVVNIAYDSMRQRLLSQQTIESESFYMLNENGNILATTAADDIYFTAEDLKTLNDSFDVSSDQMLSAKWLTIGSESYCVSALKGSDYGITYLSFIPKNYLWKTLMNSLSLYLLILFAEFVLATLVAYIITRNSFRHIEEVIELFSNAEKGIYPEAHTGATNDEYDLILTNIIQLFLNTTFLDTKVKTQEYEKKLAELTALQTQINPHFLFNTLQALDFEAQRKLGHSSAVNDIISKLSDILKYSLSPASELVTFREECDILKKYIAIQKYRFGNDLVFYNDVDEDVLTHTVPRLILQPLIENSISHGILPAGGTGFIKLRAYIRSERLHISIIDTGIGMTRGELEHVRAGLSAEDARSIGLPNVNRRLILNYGEDAALHILSKQGVGTVIYFELSLTP